MSDKFSDIMDKALYNYTDDSLDMIINKNLSKILYEILLKINFNPTDVDLMSNSIIDSYKNFLLNYFSNNFKTNNLLDSKSDIGKMFIDIGYHISKSNFIIFTCNSFIRMIPYTFIKNIDIFNKFILYEFKIQNYSSSFKYVAVYYFSVIRCFLHKEIIGSNKLLEEIEKTLDSFFLGYFKYIDERYMDIDAGHVFIYLDDYPEVFCYNLIKFYKRCSIHNYDNDLLGLGSFANIIAPILYLKNISKRKKKIKIYI